jgi:hypothetical protein
LRPRRIRHHRVAGEEAAEPGRVLPGPEVDPPGRRVGLLAGKAERGGGSGATRPARFAKGRVVRCADEIARCRGFAPDATLRRSGNG